MRNLLKFKREHTKAQAMVEFALVLPILLLLLYGLMEVGRLLFIYASTVSAARQAARYGAATGLSPNGVPYYQDCNGIIAAANQLGFINQFASVVISYDAGVQDANSDGKIASNEIIPLNPADPVCGAFTTAQNGDRIKVSVTSHWEPITPLVPLSPFDITSTSERTILASVDIAVDVIPAPFGGTGGTPMLTVSASPLTYDNIGQVIAFTYVIKNIGDDNLIATFSVSDPSNKVTISCPAQPANGRLAPNATYTCTGTYVVTQADLDFGYFSHTAVANPLGPTVDSTTKTVKILADQRASLNLTKTPSKTASITTVTYTYALSNTGNVTLSSDNLTLYEITDDKLGNICQGGSHNDPGNNASPTLPMQIAPGQTIYCTATHSITAAEIAEGSLVNTATAKAYYLRYDSVTDLKEQAEVSATASATVITSPIALYITGTVEGAEPYLSQQIKYQLSVQNISGGPVNLTGITVNAFSGSGTQPTFLCSGVINPDATLTCPAVYYNVTQADLDSASNGTGDPVLITVTASATSGATTYTSTRSLYPVDLIRRPKLEVRTDTTANVNGAPSTTTVTIEGVLVTVAVTPQLNMANYTYTITNTGNVTLSPPVGGFAVTDTQIADDIICNAPLDNALSPGETMTCAAAREITQEDVNRGSVIGATATSGVFGMNTYSDTGKSMVLTSTQPRLQLEIQAPAYVEGAGRIVEFSYILTNTGNADLSTVLDATPYDFTTSSLKGSYPSCAVGSLPIGESTTCKGAYKTLRTDLGATIVNSTRATAYTPSNAQVLSNTAEASVQVLSPSYCSVTHGPLIYNIPSAGMTFGMEISNNNDYSIEIKSITVDYNDDPNNQQITQLSLGAGNVIWEKSNQNMNGSYTFSSFQGNITLSPGATVLFYISGWKTTYTQNGSERIRVSFSDASCADLDSSIPSAIPKADFEITKSNGVSTVEVNNTTAYTIRATNKGPDTIINTKLSDPAAAGMTKISVACTNAAGNKCLTPPSVSQLESGSFGLPSIAQNDFYEITVTAKITAAAGTVVSNTATVTMPLGTNDPNLGNNSATDSDTVAAPNADIAVTKDDGKASIRSGETTLYTIRVANNGPSLVTGLKLQDPDTPTHTKTGSITCSTTPGRCVTPPTIAQLETGYTLPTLASGEYYEIVVPARIDAAAGYMAQNTAKVILPSGVTDPNPGNNQATDSTSATAPEAELGISKNNNLSAVSSNANTTYTIRVTNSGPSAVTGAILTDPAAAGLSKQSVACSAAAGNVCVSAPTSAALEGSGAVLPLLEVGKFYEIDVTAKVTASSGGSVTNTANIAPPSGTADPNNGNNSASDTDPVISTLADLQITKTDGVTSVNTGGTTAYTIVVKNNGSATANNSVFKDPAVTGLSVTSVTCSGAACPAAGSVTVAAMQGAGITIPSLASGASVTFTVNGTMTATSGSVTNTAQIVAPASITDPDLSNNSAQDTDTINMRADLSITKTDGITSMLAGTSTTYTIVVSNAGPSPAHNAIFRDSAINGLTVTAVTCESPTGGAACPDAGDTTVVLMQGSGILIPTLPSGGSVTFKVVGTANGSASPIANSATITAPAGVTDPNTGNNSATDTANTVNPAADLAITKTDELTEIGSGAALDYTIVVTNNGPSAANGAILKDPAITGFNVTTVTCQNPSGGAVCPSPTKTALQGTGVIINTLPSGGSMTFIVSGTVTATSGALSNTATITAPAGVTDGNSANNSATDSNTTVKLIADLSITKTDGATSIVSGSPITYTIVVSNDGPSAVTGAVFKDPAVSGLTVNSVTCSASGGATCPAVSVAAMQGAGITIGNMPDDGVLTFTVTGTVTAAANSTLTNTAIITAPAGVTDPYNSNNSASDSNSVTASVCAGGNLVLTAPSPLSGANNYTWTIANGTGVTLNLTGISVTWTSSSGKLSTVQMPVGTTIASPNSFSPANVTGNWAIAPGSTTLKLIFSKTSTVTDLTLTFSQVGCSASNP